MEKEDRINQTKELFEFNKIWLDFDKSKLPDKYYIGFDEGEKEDHSVIYNYNPQSNPLEWFRQEMENDPWYIKLGRWFRLQWWMLYCLLFNNKLCRYFKYRKLEK